MNQDLYRAYVSILKEELVPAMGCTEPIAIAYAAALARKTLGALPETADVCVSANIIKNVKSVVVPHTGGLRGINAAAAAGIVAGESDRKLEVLADVSEIQIAEMARYLADTPIRVTPSQSGFVFDIQIRVAAAAHSALVRIAGTHTNVLLIQKDEEILFEQNYAEENRPSQTDRELLTVENIIAFADCVDIQDVKETLDRQISFNTAIAKEGLEGNWGANIGSVLLHAYGNDIHNRAKAMAAAGSDARMSGCELPVIINSGSGNQGMTASLPVIAYAEELQVSKEQMYRALVVSNLVTIHLKTGIGCLSAYCGATSAGCGAGAGVAYLYGGKAYEVSHTIVNAVAINSGMICDGAKASCAAKIASAVEAGLLGMQMQRQGTQFYGGDGILVKGVENTIRNVGRLARQGMAETDREIIDIMISGTPC
ncbi:MAG: serine dehydratase subunit alpha family protein [Lachnospiraceae bacterium]|nr:serine dehydratase subunit alpha family protein [Lachnospiraceae bacterium]